MRTLILILAILALVYFLRILMRSSPALGKKIITRLVIGLAAILFIFLLMTGRLPWLFALFAAALPLFKRLIPLIRYIPLLRTVYHRYQNSSRQSGETGGQQSSVQTKYFKMRLDHDSGAMDGEILHGDFTGSQLHELDLSMLLNLYREVSEDDESLALLQAYLDRTYPDWRDKTQYAGGKSSSQQPKGDMSTEEAREVLGIAENATRDEIIAAHRKLMQKVHPDHGGSTYLAAKINMAKDRLLK